MSSARKASVSAPASPLPEWIADVLAELPTLLRVSEAAAVLRVSHFTIRRLVADGLIVAVRDGDKGSSRLRIPRVELGRYLARRVAS